MAEMSKPDSTSVESSDGLSEEFELIHLDTAEMSERFNHQKLADALPKATSFSVLVSGRAGVGKSTLVNGILGRRIAGEGDKLIRHAETANLVAYNRNVNGVNVTVWDSPGLLDRSHNQVQDHCIIEMQEKCSTVDLTLYCIKMTEKRFPQSRSDNPDVNAMARITKAFGPDFWRNTIVVLTFANAVEAVNVGWRKLDASAKAAAFQEELKRWRGIIQDVLINEINVPQDIAMSVVVAPAGHYDDHQLPDRDYWLSKLWLHCLEVIATTEGRAAFVRMNAQRIMHQTEVTEQRLELSLEDQPIVVEAPGLLNLSNKAKVVLAAAAGGAGIGAGVGALAFGTAAIGAPVGLAVGVALAWAAGRFYNP